MNKHERRFYIDVPEINSKNVAEFIEETFEGELEAFVEYTDKHAGPLRTLMEHFSQDLRSRYGPEVEDEEIAILAIGKAYAAVGIHWYQTQA